MRRELTAPADISPSSQRQAGADVSRIRFDVRRMIEEDASEAEIDQYLALKGMTADQLRGTGDTRDSVTGKLDAVVRGAADTLSFGVADEFAAGMDALTHPLFGMGSDGTTLGERYKENLKRQRGIDNSDYENRFGYRLGGQIGGGVASAAGLTRNGLSLSANAVKGGGGMRKVLGASAIEGSALSALHGFGSGEDSIGDRLKQGLFGAGAGFLLGGATPLALGGVGWTLGKMVSPFKTSSERATMANALAREGIDLTAGQKTGNNALRYAENEIGGQKTADIVKRQSGQFTAATLKRAGIKSDQATSRAVDDAFNQLGGRFDELAAQSPLQPDTKMLTDLNDVLNNYFLHVPRGQRVPLVERIVGNLTDGIKLNSPTSARAIEGSFYKAQRAMLDQAVRHAGDSKVVEVLRGTRRALDDVMERSIAKWRPGDVEAWRQARRQYDDLLTIEEALGRTASGGAPGQISPSHLRSVAVPEKGDLADLARAGETLMEPVSNSTSQTSVKSLGRGTQAVLTALAAGKGADLAGADGAIVGTLVGSLLPKIAGAIMMSEPGQVYLANQTAREMSPGLRAIVNAILINEEAAAVGRRAH